MAIAETSLSPEPVSSSLTGSEFPPSSPMVGSLVQARGDRWLVSALTAHDDCRAIDLLGVSRTNRGTRRTLLLPFDRVEAMPRPAGLRRVSRAAALLALRALVAAAPRAGCLRAAPFARIDIHPYQLEPALACLDGATRLLLADEVGLGKTIQAALVIAELRARGDAGSVLVVAPAGICSQWEAELAARCDLAARCVDSAALVELSALSTPEHGPWERVPLAIVSMDFVKQPEVLRGILVARWDLVIVDEAHLAAVARERAAAVTSLARRASRVLLLTATPHPGDPAAFAALCRIGRLEGEGPILMFRRTRRSLGMPVARRVFVLAIRLCPEEQRLRRALDAYTTAVWNGDGGPATREARLAMMVLQKRAASGPVPLLASLERRLAYLTSPPDDDAVQLCLPLAEMEQDEGRDTADEEPALVLAAPGMADPGAERRLLERLVLLARAAVPLDSKLARLHRLLRRARQPALVFTEYRDTLDRLAESLSRHFVVATLHGALDPAERDESVRAFVSGGVDVLIATDAAAHGLNLQARARLVVNVELPWNPVRLEQRIGRLDRLGQRRRVHAVHLVAGRTEVLVFARLARKVDRLEAAIGGGADTLGRRAEWQTAEALFTKSTGSNGRRAGPARSPGAGGASRGTTRSEPTHAVDDRERIVCSGYCQAAAREGARLEAARSLLAVPPLASARRVDALLAELDGGRPWISRLGRGHGAVRHLVCLFLARLADRRGIPVELFTVLLSVPAGRGDGPASWSQGLRDALLALATAEMQRRVTALSVDARRRLAPLVRREEQIAGLLLADPREVVQAGLFDRRAVRAGEARAAERSRFVQATRLARARLDCACRIEPCGEPHLGLLLFLGSDPR